jgi:predicted protein tyrosine phosphatase
MPSLHALRNIIFFKDSMTKLEILAEPIPADTSGTKPLFSWPQGPTSVSCWSRPLIEKSNPPAGAVLISIYDRSDGPVSLQDGWQDVLGLRFHDTDGSQMGLEVFSTEQAQAILDFLSRNTNCAEIYVHCAAGQSRSAAVALALAEAMGVPATRQRQPMRWNDPYYNRKVYSTLRNLIGELQTGE